MNQVNCPVCGMKCVKSGKTKLVRNVGFVRIAKRH